MEEKKLTAQEALNSHHTAKVAYVNAKGEWLFSPPHEGFGKFETIYKEEKGEKKK